IDEQVVVVREGVLPPEVDLNISEPRPAPPVLPRVVRATAPRTKTVTFNAKKWVNVYLDDDAEPLRRYAQGRFDLEIPYGRHTLRFENDFGKPMFRNLVIDDAIPLSLIVVDLEPKDAQLRLSGIGDHERLTVEIAGK